MLPISIIITVTIANLLLGLITYLKNPQSVTNLLFLLFTLSVGAYNTVNFFITLQTTDSGAFFWVKLVMAVALCINVLFYLLASSFPDQKLQISQNTLRASILVTVLLFPFVFLNLVFISTKNNGGVFTPGIGMPLFLLHTIVFLVGGFVSLLKQIKHANGIEKTQTKLFLLASVIMFSFILITNLLFILILKTSAFIDLLPLYSLLFLGLMSYAIFRHKLFDINILIGRTVSFTILTGVFAFVYGLIFVLFSLTIFSQTTANKILTFTLINLVMALSFEPLHKQVRRLTDRFFFKGDYSSSDLLKALSYILSTTLELRHVSEKVLDTLILDMRITRGAFVLFDRKWKYISFILEKGFNGHPHLVTYQTYDYLKAGTIILFDELHEGPLKAFMRKDSVAALLPLIVHDQKVGVLFLGEKASGDTYSRKDINVLEILAPQLAIAIQNAQEFEEIRRFNMTLRQQVNIETKALQIANERLKQLDKLKDEFVSLASHELRTPMTAIKSYLWMYLEAHKESVAPKDIHYLKRAYESTDRLIRLVNDMLNVSRIEGGRMSINKQPVDIVGIAISVLSDILPQAEKQHITLSLNKPEEPLPMINLDSDKIKEVFFNLIGNSLKFTPSDGQVTIAIAAAPQSVLVKIIDTGKGIKKEDIPRLFQKFGMIESQYTQQQDAKGTGLGLYLSKSIIELHGGKIWVESIQGKGTTFFFTLPSGLAHHN